MTEKLLARAAAVQLLVALLTGGYAAAAITGLLPVDARSALAAHINGLFGSLLLLGLAYSLQFVKYGPAGKNRLAWCFICATYANWLLTTLKAALHVSGVIYTGQGANDAVFVLLMAAVVLPSLGGAAAWVAGLF